MVLGSNIAVASEAPVTAQLLFVSISELVMAKVSSLDGSLLVSER